MQMLLNDQEKNPLYLARQISGLLRQGEIEKRQKWLEKLVEVAPQAFETLELKTRLSQVPAQGSCALAHDLCQPEGRQAGPGRSYSITMARLRRRRSYIAPMSTPPRNLRVSCCWPNSWHATSVVPNAANLRASLADVSSRGGCRGQRASRLHRSMAEQEQQRVQHWLTSGIAKYPTAKRLPVLLAALRVPAHP